MNIDSKSQTAKNWKTKRELALHLHCSVRTISNLMKRKILPYVKTGRFVRFDTDDCDRALTRFRTSTIFEQRDALKTGL